MNTLLPRTLISVFLLLSALATIKSLRGVQEHTQTADTDEKLPNTLIGNVKTHHPGIIGALIALALVTLFIGGFHCGREYTQNRWVTQHSLVNFSDSLAYANFKLEFLQELDDGNVDELKSTLNCDLNRAAIKIANIIKRHPENRDVEALKKFLWTLKRHRAAFPMADDEVSACVKEKLPEAFSLVE